MPMTFCARVSWRSMTWISVNGWGGMDVAIQTPRWQEESMMPFRVRERRSFASEDCGGICALYLSASRADLSRRGDVLDERRHGGDHLQSHLPCALEPRGEVQFFS